MSNTGATVAVAAVALLRPSALRVLIAEDPPPLSAEYEEEGSNREEGRDELGVGAGLRRGSVSARWEGCVWAGEHTGGGNGGEGFITREKARSHERGLMLGRERMSEGEGRGTKGASAGDGRRREGHASIISFMEFAPLFLPSFE